MQSFYNISDEELIKLLKSYNKDIDSSLNDYETIIKRAEINTEYKDVTFKFSYGYLMLDLETLAFKEARPLNAVSENITPLPEERKQTEEYFKQQQEYIKREDRFRWHTIV